MLTVQNMISKPVKYEELPAGSYFIFDLTSVNVYFKPIVDGALGNEAKRAITHERLCINLKKNTFEYTKTDAMVHPVNVNIKVDIVGVV